MNNKCCVGPAPTGHFRFLDYGLTTKAGARMSSRHADSIHYSSKLYAY